MRSKKVRRRGTGADIERKSLKSLPKEPTITDKEREDILKFVENVVTEVKLVLANR